MSKKYGKFGNNTHFILRYDYYVDALVTLTNSNHANCTYDVISYRS